MTDSTKFVWVRRIGCNWVLHAQGLMAITFYVALVLVMLGLVTPKTWHLTIAGGVVLIFSIFAGALERWFFFQKIRCPACGFNATHGKTTGRPLNYSLAWSRLEQYNACPKCGHEGTEA